MMYSKILSETMKCLKNEEYEKMFKKICSKSPIKPFTNFREPDNYSKNSIMIVHNSAYVHREGTILSLSAAPNIVMEIFQELINKDKLYA